MGRKKIKTTQCKLPIQVGGVTTLGSVSVILDASSYAWAWGNGTSGQLGTGVATARSSPAIVLGGNQWRAVTVGNSNFFAALDSNSYAWAWGAGSNGSLGNNFNTNQSSPVSVVGARQWLNIIAHNTTMAALDASSYAWAWGSEASGQLGQGNILVPQSSPVSVVGNRQWRSLHSSNLDLNIIALDASSYAWSWGSNLNGVLGHSSAGDQSSPVSVLGGIQWAFVTTLSSTTITKDASSYAWAWGAGTNGQLGNGNNANQSSPVSVLGGRQWLKIASGSGFIIGLDASSYAWAWGSGSSGLLGNESIVNQSSPVSVLGGKQWQDIKLDGSSRTIGLDSSSYAWAWGLGANGSLGTGSILNQSSPTSVLGGKQWTAIYSGINRNIAIDANSYAWMWGQGTVGALGQITSIVNASSPVSVRLFAQTPPVKIFGI